MNINKIVLAFVALAVLTFSCASEENGPIVDLTSVENGAYPRLIDETDKLINLFDPAGSNYTYNVEFIDILRGELMAEYVVDMFFDDNDPSNGDNSSGPFEMVKITADQLTPNENGYLSGPTVTINGADAIATAGLTIDDVTAGDEFDFVGRVVLTDGRIFSRTNSSATVVGPAFRGHFNFTMPANCPSDLAQTVSYVTTDVWCGGADQTGTVDIVSQGGGVYNFSDWSFGAYMPCYGAIANQPGIKFSEVCAVVDFTAVVDSYGDTWTFDSSISGNEWVINWSNTYGEAGNTTLTFDGPVPFVLKD